MRPIFDSNQPALFLGLAAMVDCSDAPFPFGSIDIFQLSQHRSHIVYPISVQKSACVMLVDTAFFIGPDLSKWKIRIVDDNNIELATIEFGEPSLTDAETLKATTDVLQPDVPVSKDTQFTLLHFKLDGTVSHPGQYTVLSSIDGKDTPIGYIHFHYSKAPSLTPENVKAIESDPNSIKTIIMRLGCKFCPAELKTYTGLDRSPKLEKEGCVWQTELPSEFACHCGRTKFSLKYLKESLHGMLLMDFSREHTGLSYVRRYGHSQVADTVKKFTQLLDIEPLESPAQGFIEQHPILLARFHARRLFVKPSIVGRFQADFAIVDSGKQLWLIELEKPSLQLFKKDGHPTQALMHAYGQVTDWLRQYEKYPGAILERLELRPEDVVAVRGAVIAGRSKNVTHEVLQRHRMNPPYSNIEFMTCDELGMSLLEISKKIA